MCTIVNIYNVKYECRIYINLNMCKRDMCSDAWTFQVDGKNGKNGIDRSNPRISTTLNLIGPLSFVRTSLAVSSGSMAALMYMRALPPAGREELLGDTSADGGHFCQQKTQLVDSSSKEVLRGLSE